MEPLIKEKSWDPKIEQQIRQTWEKEDGSTIYKFRPQKEKNSFVIDTPPPYPSGKPWHIGAAAHYAQIDMIARTARMRGNNVYFPIGIDRNGLPVELYTEKKYNVRMKDTPRQKFLDLCSTALDELEAEMVEIMKNLGISAQFEDYYRTDSTKYRTLTQSTFIELWNRGLVYLDTRPNNYDWVSGTTIADAEITYSEISTKLVHMKFKVIGDGASEQNLITVASTRPELLCSCKAVIVNPEDERYKDIKGKSLKVPLYNTEVPVIEHPSADMEFGSGAVMVCSYGDQNDVAIFRELKLEEVVAIGTDGKMTEAAGKYQGLKVKQAREKVIEDLESERLVVKTESITHRTPVSERSKNPIEIIPMEEYYLKQTEFVQEIKKIAEGIRFYPSMHKQILFNWLDSISIDWPISRRRYYGTEIPIWYCKSCNKEHVPPPGNYYKPWRDDPPFSECTSCKSKEFAGEYRTFDTWMDSSVSPLFISKFGQDDEFFKMTYPATIRPQAKDIVRTWLYYTILRCYQLTNQRPWSEAWIMGYGLDEHGMKMSKSKGNVLDPLPVIQNLGADTFRIWSASEINHGYDFRCSEQKIQSSKKFLSKLWNVARLLSGFSIVDENIRDDSSVIVKNTSDRWILSELEKLKQECKRGYDEYNFFIPAVAIREFTWNRFAAHYIEMVKSRAYGTDFADQEIESARYTLHKVLATILKLLAPICPFIVDYLWTSLYSSLSIHKETFPEIDKTAEDLTYLTSDIEKFNSDVWNEKKGKNLSLKDPISYSIPEKLAGLSEDLTTMHNLKSET